MAIPTLNVNNPGTRHDVQYSLIFVNNSSASGEVALFQSPPSSDDTDILALAWMTAFSYPATTIHFIWDIDYSFVWCQSGPMVVGSVFSPSQTVPADLSTQNKIKFTYDESLKTFDFIDQGPGQMPGSLFIDQASTIPMNEASVGIGMSGFGTYVWPAQPNMHMIVTPVPKYCLLFGSFTQGQVLSQEEVTNAEPIPFPENVYSMTAILNADNTLTVQPTNTLNDQLRKDRTKDKSAAWAGRKPHPIKTAKRQKK